MATASGPASSVEALIGYLSSRPEIELIGAGHPPWMKAMTCSVDGWLARIGALCGAFSFGCAALCGMESLQLQAQGGELLLTLPEGSPATHQLYRVERSTDGDSWLPLARNYGASWQGVYPHAIEPQNTPAGQLMQEPAADTAVLYRMITDNPTPLDNSSQAARFLQQASFGPTLAEIEQLPGIDNSATMNGPEYTAFADWIEVQMALPATSLRAWWRQRSNPLFTDGTTVSPNEVAFNPAIGFILPYRVGRDSFDPDPAPAIAIGRAANDVVFPQLEVKQLVWYQVALAAPDQLRQRIAWALSQFFVIGENGIAQPNAIEPFLNYYDILVRHAFGNFRDVLGEVTWNPMMAEYLTYLDNRKADAGKGTYPDENYARELMQLFTIGLWQLNADGTTQLDTAGQAIPTYDNSDIEEFAKVFTGMRVQPKRSNIEVRQKNYIDPLRIDVSYKDFSQKRLLDGSQLGPFAQTPGGGRDEINALLDHLFAHPNTAPFVARFLIQRLVSSNPSPQYVRNVATAFNAGKYSRFGSGRRGDMAATVAAILLHPEARSAALLGDPQHGALREPLIRFLHFCRAMNIYSIQTHGLIPFSNLQSQFNQSPFDSPSVFNFYLPDFQPAGAIADQGLHAPEFQIHNDVSAINFPNAIRTLIRGGLKRPIGFRFYPQARLNTGHELSLAAEPAELVEHLNLVLTAGRLTSANRAVLLGALNQLPGSNTAQLRERVNTALSLFVLLPEFNVQQ